jgi:DeoR family fructose operon transcriptional repressor
MIPYERKKRILDKLAQQEVVNLEEFGAILGDISVSTIRRDLRLLEAEGDIVILRGGAARLKSGSYDSPVSSRQIFQVREKEIIAKKAADLVKNGEIIYIDSGSTTLRMIKHLRGKDITVVTTNAIVISEITDVDFKCIVVGGELLPDTGSLVGPIADNTLRDMFFDKSFIGATGFDLEAGINTPNENERNKKRIIKNNSSETFVLVDSSKEGIKTLCRIFNWDECTIITDKETELLKKCAQYIIAR